MANSGLPGARSLRTSTTSTSPPSASAMILAIGTAPRGIASTSGFWPRYCASASASLVAASSRSRNIISIPPHVMRQPVAVGRALPDMVGGAHPTSSAAGCVPRILQLFPLPSRLEQADAGAHRDVQAFHAAQHRDAHQLVAGFARQAAQPFAFCAQHPGQRALVFEAVQILFRFARSTDYPDVAFLQFAQCAREIGDGDVRYGFR